MLTDEGGIIFMLHRVYPLDKFKLLPNERMKISPDYLECFIQNALYTRHEFISLDTLYELHTNNKSLSKKLVLTFDDGYIDNYTHAYPILKNTMFLLQFI